jgi:hypothetical protein
MPFVHRHVDLNTVLFVLRHTLLSLHMRRCSTVSVLYRVFHVGKIHLCLICANVAQLGLSMPSGLWLLDHLKQFPGQSSSARMDRHMAVPYHVLRKSDQECGATVIALS